MKAIKTVTISYYLEILGTLWMPYGHPAAKEQTVTAGTGPFQTDVDDTTVQDLPYQDGDFASVTDFQITRTTDHRKHRDNHVVCITQTAVIRPWATEENEILYMDCMFPSEG